jgi:hypothetical protein
MPPLLIIKNNITIIITKKNSGKIHQKPCHGIACHPGQGGGWGAAWSSANEDEAVIRLSRTR